MKKKIILGLLLATTFNFNLKAQVAGAMDISFNGTGSIILQPGNSNDNINDIVIQPDGKIVFCGVGRTVATSGSNFDFVIGRRNSDGSTDTTFGTNGFVKKDFGVASDFAYNLTLQADGKIIVVGGASITTTGNVDWAIMRLMPNGDYDTTFNTTGIVMLPIGLSEDYANDVIMQPDGKILVGGTTKDITISNERGVIARLNSNGTLDSTFGVNGVSIIQPLSASYKHTFKRIVLLPSGNIIAAGWSYQSNAYRFLVAGITSNGLPNNAFGTNGFFSINTLERFFGIAYTNGFLYTCGSSSTNATLSKIDTSGAFINSFGSNGTSTYNLNALNGFYALAVQPDGRILVAGTAGSSAFVRHFLVVRYNPTGTVDATFGIGGNVIIGFGPNFEDVNAMALQADRKIVLGGLGAFTNNDMIIARLQNDSASIISNVPSQISVKNNWSVYPSPLAGNNFYIANKTGANKLFNLEIYSNTGKLISKMENCSSTQNGQIKQFSLPPASAAGTYYIKILTGEESQTIPIVKSDKE